MGLDVCVKDAASLAALGTLRVEPKLREIGSLRPQALGRPMTWSDHSGPGHCRHGSRTAAPSRAEEPEGWMHFARSVPVRLAAPFRNTPSY